MDKCCMNCNNCTNIKSFLFLRYYGVEYRCEHLNMRIYEPDKSICDLYKSDILDNNFRRV